MELSAAETEMAARGLEINCHCRIDEDCSMVVGRGSSRATIQLKAGARCQIVGLQANKCTIRLEVAVTKRFTQPGARDSNPLNTVINEIDIGIKRLVSEETWYHAEAKDRAAKKKAADEDKKKKAEDEREGWVSMTDAQMVDVYVCYAVSFLCGLQANSLGTSEKLEITSKKEILCKGPIPKGQLRLFPFSTMTSLTSPEKAICSEVRISVPDAEPVAVFMQRPNANGRVPYWLLAAKEPSAEGNMVFKEETAEFEVGGPSQFASGGKLTLKLTYRVLTNTKRIEDGGSLSLHGAKRARE